MEIIRKKEKASSVFVSNILIWKFYIEKADWQYEEFWETH